MGQHGIHLRPFQSAERYENNQFATCHSLRGCALPGLVGLRLLQCDFSSFKDFWSHSRQIGLCTAVVFMFKNVTAERDDIILFLRRCGLGTFVRSAQSRRATFRKPSALRLAAFSHSPSRDRQPFLCSWKCLLVRDECALLDAAHSFCHQLTPCTHETVPARRCSQFSGSTSPNASPSDWNSDRCGRSNLFPANH